MVLSLDMPGRKLGNAERLSVTDKALAYLFALLREKGLDKSVNVIVSGTHGLLDASTKRSRICLDKLLRSFPGKTVVDQSDGMAAIQAPSGKVGAVFEKLRVVTGAKAYLKLDVPKRLHYSHHHRIADIILLAEPKFRICVSCAKSATKCQRCTWAGYDNALSDMDTFLVARGPSFRQGASVEAISLTDVYPLVCRLLGVKPKPNNGSQTTVEQFLNGGAPAEKPNLKPGSGAPELVQDSVQTGSKKPRPGPSIGAAGVFGILVGAVVFAASVFALKEYFRRQQRSKAGYRLMERDFEPDLSLQSEPLLMDDSLSYRCPESIQLSVLSESGRGLSLREEDDDDAPPGTFSI